MISAMATLHTSFGLWWLVLPCGHLEPYSGPRHLAPDETTCSECSAKLGRDETRPVLEMFRRTA